jgi:LPXTG-motif cell wall-anchored protein
MVAAGAAVILGTVLDWVTVTPPPIIPADQIPNTEPFTGLETKSAPYLLIGAGVVILSALLLVARRKSFYGWLGFLASMVLGGIAFQNFRGINELFFDQMEGVGEPDPALGLLLVVAGAVVGVIAAAAGAAGAPSEPDLDPA